MRDVGSDQHITDPQLVRARGLESTENARARLLGQGGAVQPAMLQVLANSALGHADAVTCEQNGANLSRGAGRQLQSQLASFFEELRVAACSAEVGAWLGLESGQSLLAIRPQPAIERAT